MAKEFHCSVCGRKFETKQALDQHVRDAHKRAEEHITTKKKTSKKSIAVYVGVLVVLALIGYGVYSFVTNVDTHIGAVGSTHTHQDVKIYVNGQAIDLTQSKYQLKARHTHFEGGDGDVNHKHATGVTIADMIKPLGLYVSKTCIKGDDGQTYCGNADKSLKVYVNGQLVDDWENYDTKDLDKILISYGNETPQQIQQQLASITDKAKIESGTAGSELPEHVTEAPA
ncbi:MAG TPA: hypothetical protein VJJ76_02260 [archaeon]|nr:hypothetical protein [archaeon]